MKSKLLSVAFSFIFIAGCASMESMKTAPLESGTEQIFDWPAEDILRFANDSLFASGLKIIESNQINENAWMILAEDGVFVRLVIQRLDIMRTSVRVYSKKKSFDESSGNYVGLIFSSIDFKIKMKLARNTYAHP